MTYSFTTELWLWSGEGAWTFLTVPNEYYQEIKQVSSPLKKGFGSVRVEVEIGNSNWKTSIFPDSKKQAYLLPIKKAIRKAEVIEIGDVVSAKIKILDV